MKDKKIKLLLTGFEPFGGDTTNPSQLLIEWVERMVQLGEWTSIHEVHEIEIVTALLPTEFEGAKRILQQVLAQEQPDVVLSLGQAGGHSSIAVERVALNLQDARIPDNNGRQPIDELIEADGATAYMSTLPVKRLVSALRQAGIPSQVSYSAGTYVCNHVMYYVLHQAMTQYPQMKSGFVHIPYTPDQVVDKNGVASMSFTTMQEAVKCLVMTLAQFADELDIHETGGTLH